MQRTVTVTIDETGASSIDLAGFAGKGCQHVADEFRGSDLLVKSTKKMDYMKQEETQKVRQTK